MSKPTVCAVMLTCDRPEMARRAVECFRSQTYQAKKLLVYNSGESDEIECGCGPECYHVIIQFPASASPTIGTLRNLANSYRTGFGHEQSDILIHWDDDDWSHPNRIAEQVALLQSSGADVVGYNEMLFWREPEMQNSLGLTRPGEAWLYSGSPAQILGTSLCYWRRTWERKPFEATSQGEDARFIAGLKCGGITSLQGSEPRMIARIHAGNSSNAYRPDVMAAVERQGGEWRRVPEWDVQCRSVME